ncbi:phosphopantetheine-binding protein [Streptomyces albogriseolus]
MSETAQTIESLVLEQFRTCSGNDRMTATDDFFSSGGDSFTAVQAATAIAALTGRDLDPSLLFAHRTARALASRLVEDPPATGAPEGNG